MKSKKFHLGKHYKDVPDMFVSFYTRFASMEVCFGDYKEEEENIAYSILKSIKKVNLVLFKSNSYQEITG